MASKTIFVLEDLHGIRFDLGFFTSKEDALAFIEEMKKDPDYFPYREGTSVHPICPNSELYSAA